MGWWIVLLEGRQFLFVSICVKPKYVTPFWLCLVQNKTLNISTKTNENKIERNGKVSINEIMSETQPKTTDRYKDDDASANDHNHHGHKRRRKKRSKRHKHTLEEKEEKIEGGSFYTNNNNVPEAVLKLDNEVTKRNKRNIFTNWFTLYLTTIQCCTF